MARSIWKPISLAGLPQVAKSVVTGVPSVQVRVMGRPEFPVVVSTGAAGKVRDTLTEIGRIMSISSWLRMWQCQTYSQPKLVRTLVIGGFMGFANASTLLNIAVEPSGIIGLSGRTLSGSPKGIFGMIGLKATMVSSKGLTLRVSFQPSSLRSGFLMIPSQPARFSTCTSKR